MLECISFSHFSWPYLDLSLLDPPSLNIFFRASSTRHFLLVSSINGDYANRMGRALLRLASGGIRWLCPNG